MVKSRSKLMKRHNNSAINILVTNVYSYKNKGDAAIVLALVSEIRRAFPLANIRLQTTDVANDHDKYNASVSSSLMWILFSSLRHDSLPKRLYRSTARMLGLLSFVGLYRLFRIQAYWLLDGTLKEYIAEIQRADLIIACGGGYLCKSVTSWRAYLLLFGMCWSFLAGHYLGKPVYLYSQSVGPLNDWWGRQLVRFSLNRINLLEVREDVSMRFVERLKIRAPFVRTADPALLLRGRSQPVTIQLPTAPLQVGVTVRRWFSTKEDMERYLKAVAQAIDHVIVNHQAHVTYIPQVIASGFGDDDRVVAQQLYEHVQHKANFTLIIDDLHPFELMDLCSKMDIFVGTRMHSNIFALLGKVPVVAIVYEHKTQGIMAGLGVGEFTVDIHNLDAQKLIQKIETVIAHPAVYQSRLGQYFSKQVQLSQSAIDLIKEDFDSISAT